LILLNDHTVTGYYGLSAGRLENEHLYLDYLTAAGPRIVRLVPKASGRNLLAEAPDVTLPSPYGPYSIRGGHRLWHAPETAARTYIPDNEPPVVERLGGGVCLRQPTETYTGITKVMEIRLAADRPCVEINHILRNDGREPFELAPWAITQMALGGTAVLPQQVGPIDQEGLQPNRHLVLWSYSRWRDSRLQVADDLICVSGEAIAHPLKIGIFNWQGWLGYFAGSWFFRKRFTPQPDRPHVDFQTNCQVYVNHQFLELELLGPLQTLVPGETLAHLETWELFPAADAADTPGSLRAFLYDLP
jgi:hypothetical protein